MTVMDELISKKAAKDAIDQAKEKMIANSKNALHNATVRSACATIELEIMYKHEEHAPAAVPVDWIKEQCEQYPGMESAMWNKLLRLWEKEKTKRILYGESDE